MPKNRYFSVESPEPQPELECVVGVDSMATSELYRVKCTEAWNISVKIDQKKANEFYAAHYISDQDRIRRTIRYQITTTTTTTTTTHHSPPQVWYQG